MGGPPAGSDHRHALVRMASCTAVVWFASFLVVLARGRRARATRSPSKRHRREHRRPAGRCSDRLGNAEFPIDRVFCVLLSRRLVNKPAFIGMERAPDRVSVEPGKAAAWSCARPCRCGRGWRACNEQNQGLEPGRRRRAAHVRAARIDASEIMDKRPYRPACGARMSRRAGRAPALHGRARRDHAASARAGYQNVYDSVKVKSG
jgi:hypothetical protein